MMDIKQPDPECSEMHPAKGKTVVLWGQDDVLIRAVEDLLVTVGGWRIIQLSEFLDEAALQQALAETIPDVLIVHEGVFNGDVRPLIRFVQEYSKLKIITIGLENNQMEIYNKKRVCIKESSDLLAAIQNGAASER
jgi:hypothetical protein